MKGSCSRKWKILSLRRLTQICILILIIAVPLCAQNPNTWSPSLIIQGHLPPPSASQVFGDTWSFSVGDFRITHPVAFLDFVLSSKAIPYPLFISVLVPLFMTLFLGRELMFLVTHHQMSVAGVALLSAILLFEIFFSSRAWCRSFCPSGGCLSLLGTKRIWHIRLNKEECKACNKCREVCPYGFGHAQLNYHEKFELALCDNCGMCRDACPTGAISYELSLFNRTRPAPESRPC